jgi:peptidoglycan/xylan/chitin deacetylase (PgdA/CDA1 family)
MKKIALRFLRLCGALGVSRSMSGHLARILMYHNFSASDEAGTEAVRVDVANKQLDYLRRRFRIVPLGDVVSRLASGAPLERNMVALTVDDGRRNFYEFFFPLLKELRIPATLFVVTSFIRGEDWIWTDKVLWLAGQPQRANELSPDRIESFFETLNRMRPENRDAAVQAIAAGMRVSIPKDPPAKYAPCSLSELREMADSGLVEIGSHSVTHPIFSSLTDEECRDELTTSRRQLEEGLGREVKSFCFPNGKPSDYRSAHLQLVKEAGYASAVVTRFAMAGPDSNVFELPRMGVNGSPDLLSFAKYVNGVEYFQERFAAAFRGQSKFL